MYKRISIFDDFEYGALRGGTRVPDDEIFYRLVCKFLNDAGKVVFCDDGLCRVELDCEGVVGNPALGDVFDAGDGFDRLSELHERVGVWQCAEDNHGLGNEVGDVAICVILGGGHDF